MLKLNSIKYMFSGCIAQSHHIAAQCEPMWPLLQEPLFVSICCWPSRARYAHCLLLYMLMLLMGCVSLFETWDRTRAETRVLIGGLKSRQCSPSSVKVICTHKMECSLVFFINRPDRLGPENQIKNYSEVSLCPAALFKSKRLDLVTLRVSIDVYLL